MTDLLPARPLTAHLGVNRRVLVAVGVLAPVFALAWRVGERVEAYDQVLPNTDGALRELLVQSGASTVGLFAALAALFAAMNAWLDRRAVGQAGGGGGGVDDAAPAVRQDAAPSGGGSERGSGTGAAGSAGAGAEDGGAGASGARAGGSAGASGARAGEPAWVGWAQFALLWAAWLPYWFMLWPGMTSFDSYNQLMQALGHSGYSDHHPLAMTAVIAALLVPFRWLTGSIAGGIGLVTLTQQAVLAALLVWSLRGMRELGVSARARWVALAFYALFPIVAWYSASVWKDVWLAVITVLTTVTILRVVRAVSAGTGVPVRLWIILAGGVVAMGLAKKTGVYVMVLVGVVGAAYLWFTGRAAGRAGGRESTAPAWRRTLRVPAVSWLLSISVGLGTYTLAHAGLMRFLDAKPGSVVEAYSVPSQQIAGIVRDHRAELSPQQLAEIERFYPGVDLAEIYRPSLADNTKGALDAVALEAHKSDYARLWLGLVKQHPRTALNATLVGTRGYWYPGTRYWKVGAYDWFSILRLIHGDSEEDIAKIDPAAVHPPVPKEDMRGYAQFINEHAQGTPLVGWTLSVGGWVWAAAILLAGLFIRRREGTLLLAAMVAGHWAMCMISPVHAEARYAYPLLLLLPVLAALLLGSRERLRSGAA
ncbi:DUF6020 family protein [Buchananella felis]|uniref:DUF6020 family protein n=1 Tax=Buchananella felis TaxID=3231492 RepID=UPI003526F8B5